MGIDVVSGKKCLGITIPFFPAPEIPEFTALDIKQHLAAQIRSANAKEHDGIDAVPHRPSQLFQSYNAFGIVDIAFGNIRQLREKDRFRFTVFGKVAGNRSFLAQLHHDPMGLLIDWRKIRNFLFRYQDIRPIKVGHIQYKTRR